MVEATVRVRNPRGTRQAVLDAAQRLFAANGFAGTSMRDIAESSGISQPLIHHHFGSKDDLYSQIKRRVIAGYARRGPAPGTENDAVADVAGEMQRLFRFLADNDALMRLAAWARLEGDHDMWPGEAELMEAFSHRLAVAQQRRIIRRDISARYLAIMLVGLVFFWFDHRGSYAAFLDGRPDDQAYLRQAVDLIQRGLEPRP